jgi:hypothetical protein
MSKMLGVGVIENPAATPIPAAQAWSTTNPIQSTWAGTNPFGPTFPTPANDVTDSYNDVPDVQSVPATTGTYVVPFGMVTFICATAGLLIQANINGTWTTLFTTTATATPITLQSDGTNVRLSNPTGGAISCTMYRFGGR